MSQTTTYIVSEMSCQHCVLSVEEEVSEIQGVAVVNVDLESGRLVVTGDGVKDAAVRAAVAQAGYAVTS